MAQFHWTPDTYVELMHQEVPDYERLQDEVAAASTVAAVRILELGTGTGETARRVLSANPEAHLTGIDASHEMLAQARAVLPHERTDLRVADLRDPLPPGPFDLVVSALAVHHLDGPGKASLFQRIADVLEPSGRLVLGDVIVPRDPRDAITPIDGDYDQPSTIDDQIRWLSEAGLRANVVWARRDLAVIVSQ